MRSQVFHLRTSTHFIQSHVIPIFQPFLSSSYYCIKQNNTLHYNLLKSNKHNISSSYRIRAYNPDILNLTHYFLHNPHRTRIWYYTPDRFDLVELTSSPPLLKHKFIKQNQYTRFINSHSYIIRNSYLDQHPSDCFKKLCRLLNVNHHKGQPKDWVSFADGEGQINTVFYNEIGELNKRVLEREQLKTKVLKRKMFINPVTEEEQKQRREILGRWKDKFKGFERVEKEEIEKALLWMNEVGFYKEYRYEEFMEFGKPKGESYAPFIVESSEQ